MQRRQIVLALAGIALATPALAEKCSVCDFTDEPIVVKPTKQSSDAGSAAPMPARTIPGTESERASRFGWKYQQANLLRSLDAPGGMAAAGAQAAHDDLPAGLTTEPTTQEGTFFGKVVRAGMELARREKERQQQADVPPGEPVTFSAQVAPEMHAGKSGDQAVREHVSFAFEKIIWKYHPDAGSSKPKEIVVVGSKIDPSGGLLTPNKADGQHALTSVQHAARLPAPAVVAPAGPALPRGSGPALPAKLEFGAAPVIRR